MSLTEGITNQTAEQSTKLIARPSENGSICTTDQQGAVLVIVLLIMVLMATASLIAIRNTQTSLDLTTTYQINQLLFQASDAPLLQIQKLLNDPKQLKLLTADKGPIGYLTQNNDNDVSAEYTFCYQSSRKASFDKLLQGAKVVNSEGRVINPKGYCNIASSQQNHFTSERKIIVTQLSFVRLNMTNLESVEKDKTQHSASNTLGTHSYPKSSVGIKKSHTHTPFSGIEGEDLVGDRQIPLRVYVTSVMPSFSRASLKQVDMCLVKPMANEVSKSFISELTDSQIACLKKTGTPFNIQVQDYIYALKTVPND
ncbi:hypothetical protein [uncultured Psychrobacter sp.]|uniref:hypothetical protein n=1 Tax=uncultured Psychrobacter sp. TaxID=259303 RepID=UPI00259A36A4|nr:hypothetical protein [uncultured Psychrobacter sp.]